MRVLIVADSPEFNGSLVSRLAPGSDRIIVTDGAVHKLPEGVFPHAVIGDFESMQMDAARARFPYIDYIHDPDQYRNDLEKAIERAITQGATDIVVVCALGGRPDQHQASLSVAMSVSSKVDIELRQAGMRCVPLVAREGYEKSLRIGVKRGCVVSLLPMGEAPLVSIHGVEYELSRAVLREGALGVGNRATSDEVSVTVHSGRAFFYCDE
jgi:thiamine pyrophosphokinase